MSSTSKRQRITELNMGRGGESTPGGTLRLDISSCLNPIEAEVMAILLEAVRLSESGTVVRVAGGWVRDKLLGLENEDIDIALDNCTGVAFAEMVNNLLKSRGQDEGKVAVIEANPEQSKHLETARMKIMGVWVDLVNLRTEVYRSDSRIPEASFGTAKEDALRRDFTLNALFYNVNEGTVEDETGRGVEDLRDGIIRTPLSPMITFGDDPLRLLRAVRFAARFGFTLHQDLRAAAQDDKIQAALRTKVSRERVGAELLGMITGKMAQPALALSLLQELGLAAAVYAPPEHLVPPPPEGGFDWAHGTAVARAAAHLLSFRSSATEVEGEAERPESEAAGEQSLSEVLAAKDGESTAGLASDNFSKRAKEVRGDSKAKDAPETLVLELFLCAALLPLAGVKHKTKKGKLVSAAQSIVADSLKLKAKEAKNVGDILELSQSFRELANGMASLGDPSAAGEMTDGAESKVGLEFSRLSLGLAIRQAREMWPTCVDLCCAVDMCSSRQQPLPEAPSRADTPGASPNGGTLISSADHEPQSEREKGSADMDTEVGNEGKDKIVINKYESLREAVASMGLKRAWEMEPLVRGNELMAELHLTKGPEIGKQMVKQVRWQLENPEGTREQCVAFLRAGLTRNVT